MMTEIVFRDVTNDVGQRDDADEETEDTDSEDRCGIGDGKDEKLDKHSRYINRFGANWHALMATDQCPSYGQM